VAEAESMIAAPSEPAVPAKRAKRLVVVCQLFYPELVSTGQTLTELIEELSGRGSDVTVIAAQPTVIAGSQPVAPLISNEKPAYTRPMAP
jgi:hypothetical protein